MTGSNNRSDQARVRDAGTESGVENSFTRPQESNPLLQGCLVALRKIFEKTYFYI